jgi:hypothetical protein
MGADDGWARGGIQKQKMERGCVTDQPQPLVTCCG